MSAVINTVDVRGWNRYADVKRFGVKWDLRIPSHWQTHRLKEVADARPSNVDKKSVDSERPVLLCNYVDVYKNDNITSAIDFMKATASASQIEQFSIETGDVIITKDSEAWDDIGVPAYVPAKIDNLVCGYHLTLIRPNRNKLIGSYLKRCLEAEGISDQFRVAANGITRFGLGTQDIRCIELPVPPLPEQRSIAAFLDRETARIDALIERKQRLINLLEEKRQAVISHAVTNGLNSSIELKDSGTKYYPKIPAHWSVTRLRYLCKYVTDGPHFSPRYVPKGEGVMFLSARNIKVERWSLDDAKYVSQEDHEEFCRRVIPEAGDILYTKGGTTGIARVVDLAFPFNVWVHIAVLKVIAEKANSYFLAYALNGASCYAQSQLYTRGATNNDLGLTRLVDISLAIPDLDEQQEITEFLDHKLANIADVGERIQDSINHLQEYRTALISAAVTGQIDVREEVQLDG